MMPEMTAEHVAARYDLVCRAVRPTSLPDDARGVVAELGDLRDVIAQEFLALARRGSPDHFAELYLAFERELDRFAEFCAFPDLAQRFVVGFGGAFSAGKSSLINALLDERLLVVEVDPITSLPSYLLHGDADRVYALNLHRQRIHLSTDEFRRRYACCDCFTL